MEHLVRRLSALAAIVALSVAAGLGAPALADSHDGDGEKAAPAQSGTFDPTQEQAIERIVRAYILEHPEIIVEAVQTLRARERQATEERRQQTLADNREALHSSDIAPVLGNPAGDVTLVEFFDYRCPYCRSVSETVRDIVADDGNVRLVLKEFPILGTDSLFAARAALAAARQDAYEEFHYRLMSAPQKVGREAVLAIAEDVGLDVERLQQDMQDEAVDAELRRNYRLAEALEINGTPAFVIGDALVPGAVGRSRLERLLSRARSGEG